MPRSWISHIRRLFYPWHLPIRRRPATAKRRRPSLLLEPLEARWLPSTFTVMDNSDSGSDTASLRYLLGHVSAGDVIDFAPSVRSITLTTGTLTIGTSVKIVNDQGVGPVTISGADTFTVFTVDSSTTATLSGLTITHGNAGATGLGLINNGGGINNNGTLTVSNSTFTDNSATYVIGGGIYNGGTLTVTASTFAGNAATYGGAIFSAGTLTVSGSTLSGNSASGDGGGIFNINPFMMTVSGSTLSGNSASGNGGGIANELNGQATLNNTLVANSTAGGDLYLDSGSGSAYSGAYVLIGDGSDSSSFSHVLTGNPLLAPLGNYGGPTQTLALLPGSHAIQAGESINGITTDQRGFSLDNPPDIGAFQYQSSLVVNTTADSDSFGLLTLRDAIAIADADTTTTALPITFDPSVFASPQTITLNSGTLTLGAKGTVAPITITGPSAGVTISGANSFTVFTVNGSTTATLSGLTIANGNATSGNGGGIDNELGTLTVSNSTFSGNSAGGSDGGGGIENDAGTLTVSNSTFSDDSATSGFGGGIDNDAGTLTVSGSTFSGNFASGFGGGIENDAGTLTVSGNTITNNSTGTSGGGIDNDGGSVTVTTSTLSDNSATTGLGGGVYNNGGTLTVSASTLYGNAASSGGGLYNDGGTLTVTASTLSDDSAPTTQGGGLYNNGGTATLNGNLVAGNIGGDLSGDSVNVSSSSFNLIGSGGSGGLTNSNGNQVNVNLAAILLAPLGNYGGPTRTIALLPGSLAIGSGSIGTAATPADQRGFARPIGSAIDVGAFQSQSSLVVNTTADSSGAVSPGLLTLRQAINFADADTTTTALPITFDPTVFASSQTITLTGGTLTLGSSSTVAVAPITITGPSAGLTISGADSTTVFTVNGSTTATLSGLTIAHGLNSETFTGGGIQNDGTLTVNNSTFANDSALFGGGINNSGTLTVDNSTFSHDSATQSGGGIDNDGTLTVNNSTFANDSAADGGGIRIFGPQTVTVSNSTFANDSASVTGGGISNEDGVLTVNASTFTGNYGGLFGGGGIYNTGTLTVSASTFANNSGGGIDNIVGMLTVSASTFANNSVSGIFNNGTLTVSASTFTDNSANAGGGIDNDGTLTVSASTLVGNSAKSGGGIYNAETATLNNDIVAGNSGGDLGGDSINVSSSSFNLIGTGGDSVGLTNGVNGNQLNVALAQLNLAPLGNYGGPTQTIALLPGSIAIGSGPTLTTATTDQRGFARPIGSPSDVGAFQSGPLVVNTTADSDSPGLLTLRDAIAIADADTTTTPLPITFSPTVFASSQTITLTGGTLTLGGSGTIAPISITGPSAGVTISGAGLSPVFTVDGSTTASLSSLTITHGFTNSGAGGGILNNGTLTVSDSTFSNDAAAFGGAIHNGGTLTITGSLFSDDSTTGGFGFGGGLDNGGSATVGNSTFSGNFTNGDGGGIYNNTPNTLTINNSVFSDNLGSGITNFGTLTVGSSTVSGNSNTGILNYGGSATVSYSTLSDDSGFGGGALSNADSGTLTVNNSTLSNDSAFVGGGIDIGSGMVTVNNSTITDDSAAYQGGGIDNDSAALTVTNSTLVANSDTTSGGGGIYNFGTTTLNGDIVAGNGGDLGGDSVTPSSSFNLIGTGGSGGLTNGVNGNQVGVSFANVNLSALGNHGGQTQTLILLPGSFALGKGLTETATNTDQRGVARPITNPSDVGAVEDVPPVVSSFSKSSTGGQVILFSTADFTSHYDDPEAGAALQNVRIDTLPLAAIGTLELSGIAVTAGQVIPENQLGNLTYVPTEPGTPTFAWNGFDGRLYALTDATITLNTPGAGPTITTDPSSDTVPGGQPVTFIAGANGFETPSVQWEVSTNHGASFGPVSGATSDTLTFTTAAGQNGTLYEAVFSNSVGSATTTAATLTLSESTSTTLTVSPAPAVQGQPTILTAKVTVSGITPTGTITFFNGTTVIGQPVALNGTGTATYATALLPLGNRNLTATYTPDAAAQALGLHPSSGKATLQVNAQQTVGVFDPATATWYLNYINAAGAATAGQFQYGAPGWFALTGDFTGDGQTTVVVVDPTTETWYIRNSNTPGAADIAAFQYGEPGWIPFVGDWNGSGVDGIGVYDPTTATWYLRNEASPGAADAGQFVYGEPNWVPVVGNWAGNANGQDGIAVVDPTTETWYVRNTPTTGGVNYTPFAYGGAGWTPLAGDWTGSGKAGIGVYDPTGTFYLRTEVSSGAPDAGHFAYGLGSWTPLAGQWANPSNLSQQLIAAGIGPGAATLSNAVLQSTVQEALGVLTSDGVNPALVQALGSVNFTVGNLPPGVLDNTFMQSNSVVLSGDASGYGWYTDTTAQDSAFAADGTAVGNGPAAGHEDLLTAVLHGMGNLAGQPDVNNVPTGPTLMDAILPLGARRLDALDVVFASGSFT